MKYFSVCSLYETKHKADASVIRFLVTDQPCREKKRFAKPERQS
jgi:hypothetical protein